MKAKEFSVIRQTVLIVASPDEVYEAYVEPTKHAAFTGSGATGSPKVGGKFTAWDDYITGRFIELHKGKSIVHEWKTTEWPAGYPSSNVRLTLKRKAGKTQLSMTHSRVPASQAANYAKGWKDYYWEPMKKYFKALSDSTA